MTVTPSRFISEEDIDLTSLSDEEFTRLSEVAFKAAQNTNDQDAHIYRSGCLAVEPGHEDLLPLVRTGAI